MSAVTGAIPFKKGLHLYTALFVAAEHLQNETLFLHSPIFVYEKQSNPIHMLFI